MRISRKVIGDLFVLLVLFASSGALESFTQDPNAADAAQGSPLMKALWAVVYIAVLLRILPRYPQILRLMRANKWLVLLTLFAIFSTLWSLDPGTTIRKSVPLLFSALIGFDFASRYSVREQVRLIWGVLAVVILLGVIAQVVFPGLVPIQDSDPGNAWNGIVSYKNDWARLIVLTGVLALSRPRPSRRSILGAAAVTVIVTGLLLASRSATGLIVMFAMMLLFVAFKMLRWGRGTLILTAPLLTIVIVLAGYLAFQNLDSLTAMVGRDTQFTGRVPLWRESLISVSKRPIWGYGYSAFWGQSSAPAWLVRKAVNWPDAPHAHNGYIDLTLGLGVLGLLMYFAAYLIGVGRAIRYFRNDQRPESVWPLAYLSLVFLYQLTESSIVSANQLFWILFCTVLASLAMDGPVDESTLAVEDGKTRPVLVAGD